MNPERARQLRDQERGIQRPHPLALQAGTKKHREIRFNKVKHWQIPEAYALLESLPGLEVAPGSQPNAIAVSYEITEYCMEALEQLLVDRGFHLDSTLYCKLIRALVYFSEETQRRNLGQPERLIKKSHEVYSQAWEHHPHGDHDDTPPELREYK
ncbi:hypothetical protein [Sulfuricystis multivorans]|uniref:hypothetical protein n=1 Tax=Sulfuricystis multivorans TaxID=2211108 RepID=UPI000F829647|nr:hypothetical protein [Sulfuricystis multivorans]